MLKNSHTGLSILAQQCSDELDSSSSAAYTACCVALFSTNNSSSDSDNDENTQNSSFYIENDADLSDLPLGPHTQESDGEQDDDDSTYPNLFLQSGNAITTLLAMAVGIRDHNTQDLIADLENDALFANAKNKKSFKPTKEELILEVNRRKDRMSDTSKTNKQRNKQFYLDWLNQNVALGLIDLSWVKNKVSLSSEPLLKMPPVMLWTKISSSLVPNGF